MIYIPGYLLLISVTVGTVRAQEPAPERIPDIESDRQSAELFEKHVRPLLAEHCQACHGSEKQEAGLRLDSAAAFLRGSDNGLLLDEAVLEDSRFLRVVRYADDTKMPPKGKLGDREVEILTQWVKAGAYWPADAVTTSGIHRASVTEVAETHWAFQPVRAVARPKTGAGAWETSPIDGFILDQLTNAGLTPSPETDRRTLIRRATFDLHGLPPTPEEVAAFAQDTSPRAFENLVNRLLESPRYGERWGRHWLDVARYSDTKGYVRLNDNPSYPAAWTYRDYVIRAFNEDLPYDRFLIEQLAADQLQPDADPRTLAAMGFLTLGQRFINSQHDIIDDRIDVVTRGLLGMTVSCARCHDHKFDPIPTADYYSLHGVFASCVEPDVPPLIVPQEELAQFESYRSELQRRTGVFEEFLKLKQRDLESSFRARAGEYLLAGQFEKIQANFLATMFLVDSTKELNPVMTQRWAKLLEQTRHSDHPVLAPWHQLARLYASAGPDQFPTAVKQLVADWNQVGGSTSKVNAHVRTALSESPPHDLAEAALRYGKLFQEADQRWQDAVESDPAISRLTDSDWEQLRQLQYGPDSPAEVGLNDVAEFLFVDATAQNQFHAQQRSVEDWIASPGAAPHAHVLYDSVQPVTPHIFLRGNASRPGEPVPRRFLEVLCRGERHPFQVGSGRLELARAIADRSNPLTARVMVNRVWLNHFGAGLVRTPSDFGLRGEAPTHPELLDYLAWRFMEDGWSVKSLHRLLMLSSVYQQQSRSNPTANEQDPENRLWWRMNRRRLDWESLHDSLLAVSGRLDLKMSGQAVDLLSSPFSARRAVYGMVDRQNVPNLLRTFDFVAPDATSPQRHQTTVPQQALFLMNSPFVKEQAVHLSARIAPTQAVPDSERVDAVYQVLFGRAPDPEESELILAHLNGPGTVSVTAVADQSGKLTSWEEIVQALMLSNEFSYID